jgi:hypothetical protein
VSDFSGGVGLVEMDELVFCLPEEKWMSIYVHWAHLAACGPPRPLVPIVASEIGFRLKQVRDFATLLPTLASF